MYRRNMATETNIRTGAEWEVSKCLVEWKDAGTEWVQRRGSLMRD